MGRCVLRVDDAPAGVLGLVLNDNGLSGPLPQTLARLHRLRHLDLRHNALTGEIGSAFGALRGLTSFSSAGTRCAALYPELGAADKMERLDLSDNAFVGQFPNASSAVHASQVVQRLEKRSGRSFTWLDVSAARAGGVSASNNNFASGLVRAATALAGQTFGLGSKMRLFDVSHNALAGPAGTAAPRRQTRHLGRLA